MSPEKPADRVVGMQIPDDDVPNWIQTLQEGGMSAEEIDVIMSRLNKNYLVQRFNGFIEEQIQHAVEDIERHTGKGMSDERREFIKAELVKYLQSMDYSEIREMINKQGKV